VSRTPPAGRGPALAAVFLLVRDLGRSRAFYEAVAARPPEKASASEVRFGLDSGVALTLHADLDEAGRARWAIPPPTRPRGWGLFLTFRADDVDGAVSAAVRAGGTLLAAPQEAPWGGRFAIVEDPDGYRVELAGTRP
jgi:uncharacterized protein